MTRRYHLPVFLSHGKERYRESRTEFQVQRFSQMSGGCIKALLVGG